MYVFPFLLFINNLFLFHFVVVVVFSHACVCICICIFICIYYHQVKMVFPFQCFLFLSWRKMQFFFVDFLPFLTSTGALFHKVCNISRQIFCLPFPSRVVENFLYMQISEKTQTSKKNGWKCSISAEDCGNLL